MPLAPLQKQKHADAYRVMVVDDSAVIRGLISRWLDAEPSIEVVSTAHNGAMALRSLVASRAEVVILDIEMPEMDGMTALPKIIELVPHVQVIMASTLTRRNAEVSLKALAAGAADYLPKPESSRDVNSSLDFRHTLLEKVKALGAAARTAQNKTAPATTLRDRAATAVSRHTPRPIVLRKPSSVAPRILAIGSSTGGPQALFEFLGTLTNPPPFPILITQHMPPTFTTILADHLMRATGIPCHEAVEGEAVKNGTIYVAPGNYHMVLANKATGPIIRLNQEPPVNYCRPSVDPMLTSIAQIYGASALTVILTGMGADGLQGARNIVTAGGSVIAQDEASSVVWGMPGAVSMAGLTCAVLPLKEIGATVTKFIQGDRR